MKITHKAANGEGGHTRYSATTEFHHVNQHSQGSRVQRIGREENTTRHVIIQFTYRPRDLQRASYRLHRRPLQNQQGDPSCTEAKDKRS